MCTQLQQRHIAAGQPFQLPLPSEVDSDERSYRELRELMERLQSPPWNLTGAYIDRGWLHVEPPQPYPQRKLLRAFHCESNPSLSM